MRPGLFPSPSPLQAKLSAMHELVLSNRLEQLRMRQREDALRVQGDIAALVNHTASRAQGGANDGVDEEDEMGEEDEQLIEEDMLEAYSDEMAPQLYEPSKLSYEDKQVPVVNDLEEKKKLVSVTLSCYIEAISS